MPLVSCTTEWLFTYFKLPQNYDDVVFVSLEYVGARENGREKFRVFALLKLYYWC